MGLLKQAHQNFATLRDPVPTLMKNVMFSLKNSTTKLVTVAPGMDYSSHGFKTKIRRSLKSVHFKKPVTRISFLSKLLSFSLKSKQSYIENDNAFERNEIRVTGFLK